MIKQEFIEEIRAPLKKYGFQKKRAYWFKKCNDIIFCINMQGSQWNKDNYYFAIGGAEYKGTSESIGCAAQRVFCPNLSV